MYKNQTSNIHPSPLDIKYNLWLHRQPAHICITFTIHNFFLLHKTIHIYDNKHVGHRQYIHFSCIVQKGYHTKFTTESGVTDRSAIASGLSFMIVRELLHKVEYI